MFTGFDSQVRFQLLEDVAQRGWNFDTSPDRKTQSMSLAVIVIGILPDDQYADLIDRGQRECIKHSVGRRKNDLSLSFTVDKSLQFTEAIGFDFVRKLFAPAGGDAIWILVDVFTAVIRSCAQKQPSHRAGLV
jgi:hypothetical protein